MFFFNPIRTSFYRFLWRYILGMVLILPACREQEPAAPVVARVGEETITFDAFLLDYALNPHYRPNSTREQARRQHLEHMIDNLYLYLAARADSLDRSPDVQKKLDYVRRREVLKYLYLKDVLERIPVSEEEAWEEYKRAHIQVRLRHLFAETREEAEALYRRLQQGESWEALAREVFHDSTLAANGGDLGFVGLTDLDPLLVDSVYHQRIGIPSRPLPSRYGYHIVKVEDVRQEVFLSREEFRRQREQYINSLRRRRALRVSAEYLRRVLRGKSVTIKTKVLNELVRINRGFVQLTRRETPLPVPRVTNRELQEIAGQAGHLFPRTLVEFDGERWTVQDFLLRLMQMPPLHRPPVDNARVLAKHIIDMVRDELLLREAYRKGYHQAPEVQRNIRRWSREVLANEFGKRIHWVAYKEHDPQTWERRRRLYEQLKQRYPAVVDTTALLHDLSPRQRKEKIPLVPTVMRDLYVW